MTTNNQFEVGQDTKYEYPESLKERFGPPEKIAEVKVELSRVQKIGRLLDWTRGLITLFLLLVGFITLLIPSLRESLLLVLRQFLTEIQIF